MGRTKKVLSQGKIIGGIILIFVTVGTHEQGMDRLFIEIDRLIDEGIITEEVFAQIGYTKYKPKNFKYKKMIGYEEMDKLVKKSNVIITHGGPGSIFHPLQYGKIPIVVPRDVNFNEHVDNHQVLFVKRLEKAKKVIGVYDINNLGSTISNHNNLIKRCIVKKCDTMEFIEKFNVEINKIIMN